MDLELKPVVAGSPDCPAEAVHGSYFRNWSSIQQQGLSRMNRTHIHLAPGLPGEDGVISGEFCSSVCACVSNRNEANSQQIVIHFSTRHEERL